ncbi:MAG: hypothetical protein HQL10_01275 [Nitrospirae bacterium]|nr:hypothetical protein [Nitrospirota bacterium]
MIVDKKEFGLGVVLFIAFWAVFVVLLSPVFEGKNLLDYMDNLYNTISKKSSYYIPAVKKKAAEFKGQQVEFSVQAKDADQAARMAKLFEAAKATAIVEGKSVKISGDMGMIFDNVLADTDAMFNNNGQAINQNKYGYDEKKVMYDWWNAMKSAEANMNKEGKFKEGKVFYQIMTKAIEPSYNYYGIVATDIKEKVVMVVISLAGYVIYTMWYGFAILFMFEGWGMKLEH